MRIQDYTALAKMAWSESPTTAAATKNAGQAAGTRKKIRSASEGASDAITILEQDHARLRKLLTDFERLVDQHDEQACRRAVDYVCAEIEIHTALEDDLFFPAVLGAVDDQSLRRGIEIARQSDQVVRRIASLASTEARPDVTFSALRKFMFTHMDHEEKELFPQVGRTSLDLARIGRWLCVRRAELQSAQRSSG